MPLEHGPVLLPLSSHPVKDCSVIPHLLTAECQATEIIALPGLQAGYVFCQDRAKP